VFSVRTNTFRSDCEVMVCISGLKVVELIQKNNKPCHTLLDVMMADTNYFRVGKMIQNNDPIKDMSVIFIANKVKVP